MISLSNSGSFKNLESFLKRAKNREMYHNLERFGKAGVAALSNATPKNTGKTSQSWDYQIEIGEEETSITWTNSNMADPIPVPIAILLQYGHGTRNGGYVQGRDYINPAIRNIFDEMVADIWREVVK